MLAQNDCHALAVLGGGDLEPLPVFVAAVLILWI